MSATYTLARDRSAAIWPIGIGGNETIPHPWHRLSGRTFRAAEVRLDVNDLMVYNGFVPHWRRQRRAPDAARLLPLRPHGADADDDDDANAVDAADAADDSDAGAAYGIERESWEEGGGDDGSGRLVQVFFHWVRADGPLRVFGAREAARRGGLRGGFCHARIAEMSRGGAGAYVPGMIGP